MSRVLGKNYIYYRYGQTIGVDEDSHNELKGHSCFCTEQISKLAQELRTKKPVSRNINAFLNTGEGGNIYLGVTDDGIIKGIPQTPYQKRHTYESMRNVLERYQPPVPDHRVQLFFIPVMDHDPSDEELKQIYECDKYVDQNILLHKPHAVLSQLLCWCERDAHAQHQFNIKHPSYVIYVKVNPWRAEVASSEVPVNSPALLHPIYEDEEGVVYMRLQASVVPYSLKKIFQMTMDDVANRHSALSKLEEQQESGKKDEQLDLKLERCSLSR